MRAIYLVRHLVTFLLFFGAVVVFYRLLRRRLHSPLAGLTGALFLILSPRIFADAFYNSKDLAFLSCFVFCLATLDRFIRHMDYRNGILHAFACGFAVDIRNLAMVVPFITVLLVVAARRWKSSDAPGEMPETTDAAPAAPAAKPLRVYFAALCFFIILFWPVLWLNPPYHFYRAWIEMSRYPWPNTVLYQGQVIKAAEIPWHYVPVWLLITTPLVYTFFFGIGAGRMLFATWRLGRRLLTERPLDVAMGLALVLPLAAVIVQRSVLYDGWRHLYFIYPSFLYFAVLGFWALYQLAARLGVWARPARMLYLAAVAVPLVGVALTMTRMHPHQYVYFNSLAGPSVQAIKSRFEMDYWGVSCREGLEYLLRHDPSSQIRVFAATDPAKFNALILPADQRARIIYAATPADADYEVTHFRGTVADPPPDKLLYSVHLGDANIMAVWKLR